MMLKGQVKPEISGHKIIFTHTYACAKTHAAKRRILYIFGVCCHIMKREKMPESADCALQDDLHYREPIVGKKSGQLTRSGRERDK